ncbi:unnamed protein product, partial [Rotaria sordida]
MATNVENGANNAPEEVPLKEELNATTASNQQQPTEESTTAP